MITTKQSLLTKKYSDQALQSSLYFDGYRSSSQKISNVIAFFLPQKWGPTFTTIYKNSNLCYDVKNMIIFIS